MERASKLTKNQYFYRILDRNNLKCMCMSWKHFILLKYVLQKRESKIGFQCCVNILYVIHGSLHVIFKVVLCFGLYHVVTAFWCPAYIFSSCFTKYYVLRFRHCRGGRALQFITSKLQWKSWCISCIQNHRMLRWIWGVSRNVGGIGSKTVQITIYHEHTRIS